MKLLIIYHLRLGDIARCLPIAKHFHDNGWQVDFECLTEYHGLFDLVPYARPIPPGASCPGYDRILDLQVWPRKIAEWHATDLNWMDFVYSLFPEGPSIDRQIVLSEPPPLAPSWISKTFICFPTGYSQAWRTNPSEVLTLAHHLAQGAPVWAIGKAEHGMAELPSIPYLCSCIAQAKGMLSICTASSILASALRQTHHHISDHPKHDFRHPNQIRIEVCPEADTKPSA
jgi:hypothetical protein